MTQGPPVRDALIYISESYFKPLQVQKIAAELNTSGSTLRRKFEGVLGRTVREEIAGFV